PRERLVDVPDLRVADHRGEVLPEEIRVEARRRGEGGLAEDAAGPIAGEETRALLQTQDRGLLPLVGRQQNRVRGRVLQGLDLPYRFVPRLPVPRRLVVSRPGEQVAAVVEDSVVAVPRDAVERA